MRVIVSLLLLVLIGTLLLWVSGLGTPQMLTFQEALFTAVSALAVTGLSTITPGTDLTFFGQVVLMALIQIGGIGFMVLAVGVLRALRRQVSLFDRQAMRDSLGLSETIEFRAILRRVLVSMMAVESIGAVLLWLHWRSTLGDATAAFYGLFHAVSAFCNAGFSLFSRRSIRRAFRAIRVSLVHPGRADRFRRAGLSGAGRSGGMAARADVCRCTPA